MIAGVSVSTFEGRRIQFWRRSAVWRGSLKSWTWWWMRREKHTLNRKNRSVHSLCLPVLLKEWARAYYLATPPTPSPFSCLAAFSQSEGSEETGGRRRDGVGEDRHAEEEGSERLGGADGAERSLAGTGHRFGDGPQVSLTFFFFFFFTTYFFI